jgi:hypothetical protein
MKKTFSIVRTGLMTAAIALTWAAPAHAANGANNYLLAATPQVRASTLAKAVRDHCRGRTAFYMGLGDARAGLGAGKGFWSLRCSGGRSFLIQVNPDGSSGVLDCSVIKAMHAGECSKPLR